MEYICCNGQNTCPKRDISTSSDLSAANSSGSIAIVGIQFLFVFVSCIFILLEILETTALKEHFIFQKACKECKCLPLFFLNPKACNIQSTSFAKYY